MTDINLKTLTPDTSLPTTGFLFGADSQASTNPSVYSTQTVATTLLGSTSLTGDVLTASAPVLNLTQQWNSVGTTFTGLKFNVDTTTYNQSAAASLLMDLQIGGTSKVKFDKAGTLIGNGGLSINANGSYGIEIGTNVPANIAVGGILPIIAAGANPSAVDLFLTRKAARNLQLGQADAATALAQTLSVQSVVAGQTNVAGANFTITGSQGTGTGAGGSIVFQVAPAGGSGTAQNALAAALTIDSTKLATFAGVVNIGGTSQLGATNGTLYLTELSVGLSGSSSYIKSIAASGVFTIGTSNTDSLIISGAASPIIKFGGTSSSFPALKRSSTTLQTRLADDSAFAAIQGKLTTDTARTAGDPSTDGYLVIYDSTGTAYKVPCVAL
jgi:hypothetical protein